MNLTFNIIFIPHSVRYLQYGVLSLLRYCDYHFRLVSNGLGTREHKILEDLVASSDRLSLVGEPNGKIIPHGDMVNMLFEQTDEEWFCFMDNDIFATAPFQSSLEEQIAQCDVFSSAYTIGADPEQAGRGYMGLHLKTPGGLPLAVTHLCVYPRGKLTDLIKETGIAFEHYSPIKSLPPIARQADFPEDLSKVHKMDTGVLMNMLAGIRGWRFRFEDLPELVHIGSIAGYTKRRQKWSKRLRAMLTRKNSKPRDGIYILDEKNIESELAKRLNRRLKTHGESSFMSPERERNYVYTKIMRNRIATYFTHLFQALVDGQPMPKIDLPPGDLCERVTRAHNVLKEVVEQT